MPRTINQTGRTLRVLVVDTHQVMRRRVVELLRESTLGAEVYETGSSTVALDIVRELGIDALVIDSGHFGNPEGVNLARALRRLQPPVGIVLLTALDVSALPHRFMPVLDAELVGKHEMNEHLAPALQRVLAREMQLEGGALAH
jgi:DNA-binding NarL/FixJ family response regulator